MGAKIMEVKVKYIFLKKMDLRPFGDRALI